MRPDYSAESGLGQGFVTPDTIVGDEAEYEKARYVGETRPISRE
jgi:hypothetical protein